MYITYVFHRLCIYAFADRLLITVPRQQNVYSFRALSEPKVITSPGYPNGYKPNLNYLWTIQTEVGFKISLNITDMNMEQNCYRDYLFIMRSK